MRHPKAATGNSALERYLSILRPQCIFHVTGTGFDLDAVHVVVNKYSRLFLDQDNFMPVLPPEWLAMFTVA
jgi:hypothetical protein